MMVIRGWIVLGAAWIGAFQVGIAAADEARTWQAGPSTNRHIDVFFTPQDDATGGIVSAIAQAKESIRVQAYLFTNRKLAKALLRAHRAGIRVEVIVDREQLERDGVPAAREITALGVPVYVDAFHAAAHNKIILIDAVSETPVVITGSYNFTVAAQAKNAENLLIIRGDRQVAAAYRKNWGVHREHSIRMQ
jgi:phosphatidylserine/phosphatidylglycerophosphate/cardiolipin synthase-like enzyme